VPRFEVVHQLLVARARRPRARAHAPRRRRGAADCVDLWPGARVHGARVLRHVRDRVRRATRA
jgi:hypothetical protein